MKRRIRNGNINEFTCNIFACIYCWGFNLMNNINTYLLCYICLIVGIMLGYYYCKHFKTSKIETKLNTLLVNLTKRFIAKNYGTKELSKYADFMGKELDKILK